MNLENIVRIGKVTAVDGGRHIARVWYEAMGTESGWLPVLVNQVSIPSAGTSQRTEYEGGPDNYMLLENHKHDLTIAPWMPKVNEMVLVLYIPVFNGDGVILGGVRPWR